MKSQSEKNLSNESLSPHTQTDSQLFSLEELLAMHHYCLKFRDLVRGGEVPTREQRDRFMLFQPVTYGEGVACGN